MVKAVKQLNKKSSLDSLVNFIKLQKRNPRFKIRFCKIMTYICVSIQKTGTVYSTDLVIWGWLGGGVMLAANSELEIAPHL